MILASIVASLPSLPLSRNSISLLPFPSIILHALSRPILRVCAASDGFRIGGRDVYGWDLGVEANASLLEDVREGVFEAEKGYDRRDRDEWLVWEDQIFEDTVPLVVFVRMILHTNKYRSGDRLAPDHEKVIIERLLPYHPCYEMKIGCGIDYITVGYHPDFERTPCLFIVRKDGELIDFSFWKCIKGLIRKNYPQVCRQFYSQTFWTA